MTTKNAIFKRYLKEYLKAKRKRKQEILDVVCDTTKMHRKSVIRRFKVLQMRDSSHEEKRGRKVYYTADVRHALKTVWEASSEVCGELIHPVIHEYVVILKRDHMWEHTDSATEKLLQMSEATVKRIVGNFQKMRKKKKGMSATKPSHIKSIIPIFTGPWTDKPPGYGQIDTVVHCGNTLLGNMIYSVNYTDVSTLWVVLSAQWNKGMVETQKSLARMKEKTPFTIFGMHPDTGSEFINWHLKKWADNNNVELTRSRPSHSNDNAYVEQKNGHVIRRFIGYRRLDNQEIVEDMNKLYDLLETYLNHFVASKKCIKKVRIGAKYKKKYDKGMSAYHRVLKSAEISQEVKDSLKLEHEKLNPLILKKKIDRMIEKILKKQQNYGDTILKK